MAYRWTVHCRPTPSEGCATQRGRPLISAAAATPLEALAATLGVPERGDGVQAATGVHRGVPGRGAHSRAPCSKFHQCSAKTDPGSPECTQIRKRNHPPPPFLDTSRISEVKPPLHAGTRRYDGADAIVRSANRFSRTAMRMIVMRRRSCPRRRCLLIGARSGPWRLLLVRPCSLCCV